MNELEQLHKWLMDQKHESLKDQGFYRKLCSIGMESRASGKASAFHDALRKVEELMKQP